MSRSPALLGKRLLTATSLALLTTLPIAANALALPDSSSVSQGGKTQQWLMADKDDKDDKDDKKGRGNDRNRDRDDDRKGRIDLNRAKNIARQAAEAANGGVSVYRAAASMHGPAKLSPFVDNGDSWTWTFLGGRPGASLTAIETVVTVYKESSRVVVVYNGAARSATTRVNSWNSLLRVARLVDQNSLVLQLDVLDRPAVNAASAFYEVYARRNNRWVSVYRTNATQLVASSSQVSLTPVVIPIQQLGLGNVDLSRLELRTVAYASYGGQQVVLRESVQRYQSLTQISSVQQISTVSATTTTTTDTTTTTGSTTSTGTSTVSGGQTVTLTNGYRVTFRGVSYSSNTSTWRYYVEELPVAQDLSNWVLGLPACAQVASASPKGERVNPDPNARISGIKWQPGGGFVQGEFSVTLNGRWAVGTTTVAVKGPDVARGELAGPSCSALNQ
ncbi:hypothetical protein H6F86_06405 [Phormidium sp. FACHB-592]|uniref:Ig-like domain-containing protein n=1 Tax=Stenomitos frigidus AS-A4 TaxID=2933935 RepID=A0ABV0KHT1_9CYAN|nr:hypothetical protein [Phormidium sp. FACHB-592]MBD2073523.1 hypothetical protein [Phormidium sp. FACHB-592]